MLNSLFPIEKGIAGRGCGQIIVDSLLITSRLSQIDGLNEDIKYPHPRSMAGRTCLQFA
jgi:hypothetical protein